MPVDYTDEQLNEMMKAHEDHILNDGYDTNISQVDIDKESKRLEHDEDLVISKRKQVKTSAPYAYTAYGNGKKLRVKDAEESLNIVQVMSEMTKPEQKVFNALNNCMLTNDHIYGVIKISAAKCDIEKSIWQEGITKLIDKELIKRVASRGSFIINPKLVVPTGDPTVDSYMSQHEKVIAHSKYIQTILRNWDNS